MAEVDRASVLFSAWFDAVMRSADRKICAGPEPVLLHSHAPCVDCNRWAGGHRRCESCQEWRDWQDQCQQGRP